ncbi:MAG: phosphate ABC transporter permease subunit PstC [Pelagibaca sp.]|uniref:phosphate ABC transporter permease subunit PstC n=1 Tax=Salipiger bermudensis TaxID=344736 RepID=UPI000C8B4E11|nr:phosphate ABC transporter permease subunit PstC [Salipiger bermudensis]MAE92474.1 phosphate ABC transporter permease subunit PstC [Pelagibaca sp.]MCA1284706.1 phosphate ABC transporter permease subunit PstC [Salipiger bermudensis]
MPVLWLFLIVLALAAIGFIAGRMRVTSAGGERPHSLPNYYGWNVAMKVMAPAFLALVVWLLVQPMLVDRQVTAGLAEGAVPEGSTLGLVMSDVRRVAGGLDTAVSLGLITAGDADAMSAADSDVRSLLGEAGVALGSDVSPEVLEAAQRYRAMNATGDFWRSAVVLLLAVGGLVWGVAQSHGTFRARNSVETGIRIILLSAASIAILTTIGIVLSLVGNTWHFFQIYPASKFFGSFTWSPSFGGGSELGIWPLLWGTLYISVIALIVAVPIGLFAAVYLSEYAGPRMRAWAKPLLEVLAGIPTIVYGLFALLTVGPLLLSVFGRDGLGWMQAGTAVMTAGLVMGIMLIPFVSSLSDDIINSVPQSLRDGSYGLGATQSETIKQVILPAALPGIVGAVLLAASRAIGETMIVVFGAGAAARLSLNPFDAMTTVTAKIVSQLTGDADFASPEALVAFALGMTLFIITLGLNVFALYIVRKYREQYE